MAKVYSVGIGGGSTKDAVEIPGGASITVNETLGSSPYAINFNQDSITVNGNEIAKKGADGKSAYDYAVDGGFTGTEAEFQSLMAQAQNLDGGPFLPLSGGEMTGVVNFGKLPIRGIDRIELKNKSSVDIPMSDEVSTIQVGSSGFTFHIGSNRARLWIGDPVGPYNATHKQYVDESIQQAILDSWGKAY